MNELVPSDEMIHQHGFARLVDKMGDDSAIVQAARVSYGAGTKTVSEDRGLIRYLMRHKHTTPFEMVVFKFHLKMPIFVARQWVRHRMSTMNEYSARYSEMRDEFYIPAPRDVQRQSKENKQGSDGQLSVDTVSKFIFASEITAQHQYDLYQEALADDVSRELARINLPLSSFTEFYWKIDLHNLLHFLKLRTDPHAQKQIRDYADEIAKIVKAECPMAYEAWEDYSKNAVTFSAQEWAIIKETMFLATSTGLTLQFDDEYLERRGLSKRERAAFCKLLDAHHLGVRI